MRELQLFENEDLNFKIRGIENDDGSISVNLEDAARGLGFTTVAKSGNEVVRWARVKKYFEDFGISQFVDKDTLIPESSFYLLAMKANNELARKFQVWVAVDVIPKLRRMASYMISDPIERAKRWIEEQEEKKALELKNQELDRKVEKLNDEVSYKEDIIINLVDGVSLSNKRDIINRVVRRNGANYRERWSAIYREFENKYHIDLDRRLDTYNKSNKPKMRNKLDYVEKVMGKLPELYEIACKLYETDVKELVQEMYDLNGENMIAPIS